MEDAILKINNPDGSFHVKSTTYRQPVKDFAEILHTPWDMKLRI